MGAFLGRHTAQLGADLGLRAGGHLGWAMCHVLVFLAPGPKLGGQNRRAIELNTALREAPRLTRWVLASQTGIFEKWPFILAKFLKSPSDFGN